MKLWVTRKVLSANTGAMTSSLLVCSHVLQFLKVSATYAFVVIHLDLWMNVVEVCSCRNRREVGILGSVSRSQWNKIRHNLILWLLPHIRSQLQAGW